MNQSIDMSGTLSKQNILKSLIAKILSFKQDIGTTLASDLTQSKQLYKYLLKTIIDVVHQDIADSEEDGSIDSHLDFTNDHKRIRFGFDHPIIQNILMQQEFLKSGNALDSTKVKHRIQSMHTNNLHHKLAKNSIFAFNEDGTPYLDIDENGITLKKDMEIGNGEYIETPSGWHSFE